MKVLDYAETVVWEDPAVVLVEERLQLDDGIESSTYTVYSSGLRVITAVSYEAVWLAINDLLKGFEDAEED